ncbi:hypothetical protein KIN20_013146, partial [Parelaphostrongylus tenuis]
MGQNSLSIRDTFLVSFLIAHSSDIFSIFDKCNTLFRLLTSWFFDTSASLRRRILAYWREAGRRLGTYQAGETIAIVRKLQSLVVEGRTLSSNLWINATPKAASRVKKNSKERSATNLNSVMIYSKKSPEQEN